MLYEQALLLLSQYLLLNMVKNNFPTLASLLECVGAGGGGGAVYDVRTNFNIHVNGWARRQQQAL